MKGNGAYARGRRECAFSIAAPKELPFTLVINLVGYKSQDVEIYELSEETIDVALKIDNILDEIVVIGYGEQKRKDITGSVASVPLGEP